MSADQLVKSGRLERIVFRPNLGWFFIYSVLPLVGGLGIVLAVTTRDFTLTVTAIVFAIIVIAPIEVFSLAYLLGMRIEVDDETVSKVYFFGLLRRRILRRQLRAKSHTESGGGWAYTRIDFDSVGDDALGFSVIPFWVWRSTEVDRLRAIATES